MLQACAILSPSMIFSVPQFTAAASASTLKAKGNRSMREFPIVERTAVRGTSTSREAEVVARKEPGRTLTIAMSMFPSGRMSNVLSLREDSNSLESAKFASSQNTSTTNALIELNKYLQDWERLDNSDEKRGKGKSSKDPGGKGNGKGQDGTGKGKFEGKCKGKGKGKGKDGKGKDKQGNYIFHIFLACRKMWSTVGCK